MENNLIAQFDESTETFLSAIALFPQEQFNQVPFAGSWTAAQVAEHVYKSESGIPHVWKGNTTTTGRPADQHVPILKSIFLDFSTKMESPDFILPSEDSKQKEELYGSIKANREEIRKLATSIDLSQTFTDFSFPQLGELTGIEWLNFIIAHSLRHANQLRKIYEHIK